jgi:hypothetical protein
MSPELAKRFKARLPGVELIAMNIRLKSGIPGTRYEIAFTARRSKIHQSAALDR